MSKASVRIPAMQMPLPHGCISSGGFWGEQLHKSYRNWMMRVSDDLLLSGFRSRPGIQPWIGEHIGKYLLSAIPTSSMLQAGDLSGKVRRLVEGLVDCQEPDGYLGTYLLKDRWIQYDLTGSTWRVWLGWDIWVFKYCMLALLDYHDAAGWEPALRAACRAADLLIKEFRNREGDMNIDPNEGLGSGSVLEPIVLLYRRTGDSRYLEFARRIVESWNGGHRLLAILRERGDLNAIGNGKAYEMLSCFVGLLEFARATGDVDYLNMVVDARDRLAAFHKVPTGGMSVSELFWRPGLFPEWASMETCVTFSWMQLNLRIFEMTGDEAALDYVEESGWNQLLPALSPDADTWSYHLSMLGPKRFFKKQVQGVSEEIDGFSGAPISCCHTNGQRGLAMVPAYAYSLNNQNEISVNFYGASAARVDIPGAGQVRIEQVTGFPCDGEIMIRATPEKGGEYTLLLRKPLWAGEMLIDGQPAPGIGRRVAVRRSGEAAIRVRFAMTPRVLFCGCEMRGKCCLAWGPLVMALDRAPDGLGLDQLALLLGKDGLSANLSVRQEDGWPVITVDAACIPNQAVFSSDAVKPAGAVELKPVLLAGLNGNPGLTEEMDAAVHENMNTQMLRITEFREYRVLLPYFYGPS